MERVLELWLRHLEKTKSYRTAITYLQGVKDFAKHVGMGSLLYVEPSVIYSYIDNSKLSVSSLFTHLSAIKHFYKFAFRRGNLSKEVYTEIEKVIEEIREELSPSRTHKKPKALTKQELESIFRSVQNTRYERVYSLFLYSGIRLSEYGSVGTENFYKDKSNIYWLRLPADITKRRKERIVPIIGAGREETQEITRKLDLWLESYEESLKVNPGSLQVFTNRLSKKLGIPFSIHSFRHTYITNLVNSGFPAEVVKEFAGHSNVKTTIDIYYRFSQERAQRLVQELLG